MGVVTKSQDEMGGRTIAAAVRAAEPIQSRVVYKRLMAARGGAHPGPSGERNTHLLALLKSPQGLPTLTRWCNAWRFGGMPPAVRQCWLHALLTPLDKGGGKARPILMQEALLKLATGTVAAAASRKLAQALRPWQYRAGGEGGAVQMA